MPGQLKMRGHRTVWIAAFFVSMGALSRSARAQTPPEAELEAPGLTPRGAETAESEATRTSPVTGGDSAAAAPATRSSDGSAEAAGLGDANEPFVTSSEVLGGEESPKLEIYGFADLNYTHVLAGNDNIWRHYVSSYPSFYSGHLNLYFGSSLGENWRSLAEVRFSYTPLGAEEQQNDGTFSSFDNSALDYAEMNRVTNWGSIEIQRVWVEYQAFDFLTIRGGQWLTPYGYWNDDHGSPTIIAMHRPFPINSSLFPERQTGLELYGKVFLDTSAIGYFLTLSNGRGPYDAIRDLDNNKAVGGRLFLETKLGGDLSVGVSGYRGRYTASTRRYRIATENGRQKAELYRSPDVVYEEFSLGADARFSWRGFLAQGEFLMNDVAYDDKRRPPAETFDPANTFAADYRNIGAYLLVALRTPFFNVMPYGMVEYDSFSDDASIVPVVLGTVGLNLRATPNVVLKAEYKHADFLGTGATGLGDSLNYFGSQVAWAF